MKAIALSQLIPEDATITVKGKEYVLRSVTVKDWTWMEGKWGDGLAQKFKTLGLIELCTILFRLLTDKEDFLPITVKDYDDDGNPMEVKVTGPERLAMALDGFKGLDMCSKALERCLGLHHLTEEQIEDAQKKILQSVQIERPAGPVSSMNSPQSMDTPQDKSES